MILHHGTSVTRARHAAQRGLLPPKLSGKISFPRTPAHPCCVYLTDTYPLYFANIACSQDGADFTVVISIDTVALNSDAFLPDEDVLEQLNRSTDDLPRQLSASERTLLYRKSLADFTGSVGWLHSLDLLGTCAFWGSIPPEAFVSLVVVDTQKQSKLMMWATDFSLNVSHFRFAAAPQKMLTQRVTSGAWPSISSRAERSFPEGFRSDVDSIGGIETYTLGEFCSRYGEGSSS